MRKRLQSQLRIRNRVDSVGAIGGFEIPIIQSSFLHCLYQYVFVVMIVCIDKD